MEGNAFVNVLLDSLKSTWSGIVDALPQVLGALVIFIIGLVLASIIGKIVVSIINAAKIDEAADKLGVKEAFGAFGNFSIANVLGLIVKWFFIIVFLIAAADILGWTQITDILGDIVNYIPQIAVAIILIIGGLIVGRLVGDFVEASIKGTHAPIARPHFVGAVARWAVIIITFTAAVDKLEVGTIFQNIVETAVMGIVLALALAFGLGGKKKVEQFFDNV